MFDLMQLTKYVSPLKLQAAMGVLKTLEGVNASGIGREHILSIVGLLKPEFVQDAEGIVARTEALLASADPAQTALQWFEQSVQTGEFQKLLNPEYGTYAERCPHCDEPSAFEPEDLMLIDDTSAAVRCKHCALPYTLQLS